MGIFIFTIALVIEILLAVLSFVTKSNQQRIRSTASVIALAVFMVFTISSVVDWSFRYYSIAALLLFLAIIGGIVLIRKREDKKPYKTTRIVFKAIGMTVVIFMFTLPSIIYPQHKGIKPTGEYQVERVNYSFTDINRVETYTNTGENRKLNVAMWFPKNAEGKFPLIVFSPGAFGTKTSNTSLYNELASHGYVVCSIDHTYQCLFTTGVDGHTKFIDMDYMKEISTENDEIDKVQSFEFYQKWMKIRTEDISFVIDYVLKEVKNHDTDKAYNLMDATKIGVMGYSLGGSAALGIGRIRDDINAIVALESSFLWDIKGVKDGEFIFTDENYPIPMLNVYSDQGWNLLPNGPQYAKNYALLSSTNSTAHNIHIRGVGHLNLTNLALERVLSEVS